MKSEVDDIRSAVRSLADQLGPWLDPEVDYDQILAECRMPDAALKHNIAVLRATAAMGLALAAALESIRLGGAEEEFSSESLGESRARVNPEIPHRLNVQRREWPL